MSDLKFHDRVTVNLAGGGYQKFIEATWHVTEDELLQVFAESEHLASFPRGAWTGVFGEQLSGKSIQDRLVAAYHRGWRHGFEAGETNDMHFPDDQ